MTCYAGTVPVFHAECIFMICNGFIMARRDGRMILAYGWRRWCEGFVVIATFLSEARVPAIGDMPGDVFSVSNE